MKLWVKSSTSIYYIFFSEFCNESSKLNVRKQEDICLEQLNLQPDKVSDEISSISAKKNCDSEIITTEPKAMEALVSEVTVVTEENGLISTKEVCDADINAITMEPKPMEDLVSAVKMSKPVKKEEKKGCKKRFTCCCVSIHQIVKQK